MDEYVSAAYLAQLIGLSARRIQQLVENGVLPATDKEHGRKYNLKDAVHAYIEHLKNQAEENKSGNRLKNLQEEKLRAEVELKQSQGELHQLKTQIAQGNYISIEEAKIDLQKFFVVFKKFALAIPPKVGGMISAYADPVTARSIEKSISVEVNDMLRSFVGAAMSSEESEPNSKKQATSKKAASTKRSTKKSSTAKPKVQK